jgi:hypothetical protein
MANYRTPRKLNLVSGTMLLLFLGALYWGYVFAPSYWDAWTVDHELREGAAESYQLMLRDEKERNDEMRKLLQKVRDKCVKLANITDPDFDVTMDIDGDKIAMHAIYSVVVQHPVGNYKTVVHFDRTEKADNKRVQWE